MMRVFFTALAALALMAAPARATTITVDSANSAAVTDGNCTLREAISAANTNTPFGAADACSAGQGSNVMDKIVFNIGAGNPTINLAAPLQDITEPVEIHGELAGGGRVVLNGTSAGAGADGLRINTLDATINRVLVSGLVINRFPGDGIEVVSGKLGLTSSLIGTDPTGATAQANGGNGVNLSGGLLGTVGGPNGTTPGGACTGDCNVISGNSLNGVLVDASGTSFIRGNHIGVSASGTVDRGNVQDGIHVTADNADIGGLAPSLGNVISGNNGDGIEVNGASVDGAKVRGNLIGTDTTGGVDLGNTQSGVRITDAPANAVGSGATGAGNVISGNNGNGVLIENATAMNNLVAGNLIGTDATGTADLGNGNAGVFTQNSSGNVIGGDTAGERNLISGNVGGVDLNGAGSDSNVVSGNYIGTDITGTLKVGNVGNGIDVAGTNNQIGGPAGVTVGGPCTGQCNLVSGNSTGVHVGDPIAPSVTTEGNVLQGNYIGTTADGTAGLGNIGAGVSLALPSTGTDVGGDTAQKRNVIAGNGVSGVQMLGPTSGNTILGNFIGVGATGGALGNGSMGVRLAPQTGVPINNMIGGDTAAKENVISNHPLAGITISGDGADGNVVLRNTGTNNGLFLDIGSPDGPGNGATGANAGVQAPVVTVAGASLARGTADPGSEIIVFRTSDAGGTNMKGIAGFVGGASVDASGKWELVYSTPLGAGQNIAAIQVKGTGSSEASLVAATDAAAPETTIASGPADGSVTADSTPEFGFESEAGATFQCSVDGGAFAACSSPQTLAALPDGQHSFSVRATDTNANTDPTPAQRTFTVDTTVPDTTAPDTQISSAPPPLGRSTTVTTTFSSTEPGSSFACSLDGGAFAPCSSPDARAVSDGSHTFQVRATDAVGNTDASPASATFRVDSVRPAASKLSAKKRVLRRGRGTTFRFRLSEAARAVVTIEQRKGKRFVRRGRLTKGAAKAGQNSVAFAGRFGKHKLPLGRYRATLIATDPAGNVSKAVRTTFRVKR